MSKSFGQRPRILPAFGMIPIVLFVRLVSNKYSLKSDSWTHSPRRANLGTLS